MNRADSLRLIRAAYSALEPIQNGWTTVAETLFAMNKASEKRHRAARDGLKLSVNDAAKLFTARHLAEALEKPGRYTVDDILSIRTECLYAQAFAKKFESEIRAAWQNANINIRDVLALDYAALV